MDEAWRGVDEGWGRKAVDFATLSEPGNCREYVAMHHRLGVDRSDRLLDVACGSGLALELAMLRGPLGAGMTRPNGWWPSPETGIPAPRSWSET